MPELPGRSGKSSPSMRLVERLEGAAIGIERRAHLAQWEAWTTGRSDAYDQAEVLTMEYKRVFAHRKDRAAASRFLAAEDWSGAPFVRRRLQVLYRLLVEYGQPRRELEVMTELESNLDRLFSTFRPNLDGQPISTGEVTAILEHSTDRDRRYRAWSAQKAIGPLAAPLFIELMTRRNKMARNLGYPDFWHMQLELSELDAGKLLAILDSVREHTDEPFRKARTEIDRAVSSFLSIAPGEIRPWDMSDPFFQELPGCLRPDLGSMLDHIDPVEVVRAWFAGIGFDVDTILQSSSLYEAPGKNSHAFSLDLGRAGDVRILCNVRNNLHWHTTLLHELGHALYSAHIDRSLPWSLRAEAHSLTTEGVAMFFEAMASSEDYLARIPGPASSQSEDLAVRLRRSRRLARLIFSR